MSGPADRASSPRPAAARTVNLVKDPTGAPAVNLTKVREAGHIDLVKRAEKAGISLSKRNLGGLRGAVRLYVDHSRSMELGGNKDYSNGNVQRLVERALGYAFQLDSDGKIPVIAFDSDLWPEEPIFAIIVTDGSPNDGRRATQLIIELARYPVQIKFLAIREVGYLQEVDDLEEHHPGARLLDNVDAKFFNGVAWPLLTDITDLQFAEAMADELDTWLSDAIAKGVLSL